MHREDQLGQQDGRQEPGEEAPLPVAAVAERWQLQRGVERRGAEEHGDDDPVARVPRHEDTLADEFRL